MNSKRTRSPSPSTKEYLLHCQQKKELKDKEYEEAARKAVTFADNTAWTPSLISKAVKYARGKQLIQILQKESNPMTGTKNPTEVINELQCRYLEQLLWSAVSYKLDSLGFNEKSIRTSTLTRDNSGKTVLTIGIVLNSSDMENYADRVQANE